MPSEKLKLVAIGAAPTSLGFAYRLNELIAEGNEEAKNVELTILEQESVPGGLSCTVKDDKGFLWDMGGHITFSHNFPYYEKATRWAVDDWNQLQRNCLVDMNYLFDQEGIHLVPYPAQFAVPLFPEDIKRQCMADLKQRYENPVENSQPANFEEWILQHFGPTILSCFFKPYTRKVWTVDTAKMSPNWVGTRVAKLPQEKLESLCAMNTEELEKADFGWGPNASFSFPTYGGTGAVWKQMADKLPQKWFNLNSRVVDVDHRQKQLSYMDTKSQEVRQMKYDALINTAPIDLLVKQTGVCPELQLDHNQVFIVGVGLKLPIPEDMRAFTWLYFPDPKVPFYRVTFLSRYGEVTPDSEQYWSVMCECARTPDDTITEEEIRDQAVEGLITKSIIKRDQIVSIYSTRLPYGYPIPSISRDSELARAHKALESNSIYSRGRFGGWKYEVSNQDHCFIQGKELADRLILGESEKLYRTGVIAVEKRG